jgi:hypothetical protein
VYTVIPWFAARRARKSLAQLLHATLTDQRADEIAAREEEILRRIDEVLVRLPPPAPPPPRALQPGEHDFSPRGLCWFCGQGSSTLLACPGTKREEASAHDRFELIELD